jgi:hypothetical protein
MTCAGDVDVVAGVYGSNKIVWYESNGGSPPSFTARSISTATGGPHGVFAADMDGDGDVDVLSVLWDNGKVQWHESNGAKPLPSFTTRVLGSGYSYPADITAADVDGDGDLDGTRTLHDAVLTECTCVRLSLVVGYIIVRHIARSGAHAS